MPTRHKRRLYINNTQNPNNDAIQNALALNRAKINVTKSGGATTQQKQQIQQEQQQKQRSDERAGTQATATVLNGLNSTLDNVLKNREVKLEASKAQFDYVGNKLLDRYYPVRLNNKWGYINEKGKLICPVKYDEAGYMSWSAAFGSDKYIRASVRLNGKWGLINMDGKSLRKGTD